jgi:hypothetical protein
MKLPCTAAVALLLLIIGAVPAMADTSTSTFEPPAYSIGSIAGQNGWLPGVNPSYDQAVVSTTGTGAPNAFGQQSLRMSDNVTSGSFGDWVFSPAVANEAGEHSNHLRFTAEFSFLALTIPAGAHISISPDNGQGARMSYVRLESDGHGVHAMFEDVVGSNNPASFVESDVVTLDASVAHTVKFDMQFVDGASNDVVKLYIDGSLVKTGTSWENYYRYDSEAAGSGNVVPNASRVIMQARGTATDYSGTLPAKRGFLFDNVSLGTPDEQGPGGATGATVVAGAPTTVVVIQQAASEKVRLIGAQLRIIHVQRRKGEKFLSARAILRGKSLKVRGRAIQVDLRNKSAGIYNVHIVAKYRSKRGNVHIVRSTRNLSVTVA